MTTDKLNIDPAAQQVLDNIASGVGASVWWRYRGTKITPDELRARFINAGLDPDVVQDIDPVTALKAQVRGFKAREVLNVPNGVNKNGEMVFRTVRKRVIAEVISKSDSEIVVGIFHHVQSTRIKAKKEQQDTLVWDLLVNDWKEPGTSNYAERLRAFILDHQTNMRGWHIRDYAILPMLKAAGGFAAVPGWYYVPTNATASLAKLQKVVEGLDSFSFSVAAMPQGMGWEEPMANGAEEHLSNDLEALEKQIDGWKTMSRKVRQDTRQHVLARFDDLHSRAEAYEASLSVTLDDLRDQIGEMRNRAEEVIDDLDGDLDAAREDAKAKALAEREAAKASATDEPEGASKDHEAVDVETNNGEMTDADADRLWEVFFTSNPPTDRAEMRAQLDKALTGKAVL